MCMHTVSIVIRHHLLQAADADEMVIALEPDCLDLNLGLCHSLDTGLRASYLTSCVSVSSSIKSRPWG